MIYFKTFCTHPFIVGFLKSRLIISSISVCFAPPSSMGHSLRVGGIRKSMSVSSSPRRKKSRRMSWITWSVFWPCWRVESFHFLNIYIWYKQNPKKKHERQQSKISSKMIYSKWWKLGSLGLGKVVWKKALTVLQYAKLFINKKGQKMIN